MNVLVTGGSGFLGAHTVPLLVAGGHQVAALARSDGAATKVAAMGARAVRGDLDVPVSVADAFAEAFADTADAGAEALVNLASLGFGHAPAIVAAAERAGIGRAVFVSTTSLFTRLDARSKAVRQAAEDAIRASGLDWTIVRPTMIYGTAADRNMARLLHLVRRTPVVPLPGGGHGLQQPVHVDDLAAAIVAALDRPVTIGRAYDLAGPEPLTLRQVVEEAAAAAGRGVRFVSVPAGAAVAATGWYERLARRPRLTAEQVARLAEDKAFDISPARTDLGFDPRTFRDGIRQQAAAGASPPG